MAGSKGSKYYDTFLQYQLNLESVDKKKILDHEGFNLLLAIDKLNSIAAAADKMNISYRKAWEIIRSVENELGFQLVIKQRGGSDGGNTVMSPEGRDLLEAFKELCQQFDSSVSDITRKFFRKINHAEDEN
jgi:molybdate transport system regulatory protein